MSAQLPAEKTHYRRGLALGLTLAETFSIVVFILLLACAALLRFEQVRSDTAEAQRDTARVDLLITQEMVRGDSVSWGNANAWFERSRELVREAEAERRRVEDVQRSLERARTRVAEIERQLADGGAQQEVVERLGEQAVAINALQDSLARTRGERQAATVRADSLFRQASAQGDSLRALDAVAELAKPLEEALATGDSAAQAAEAARLLEQATRADQLEDSLAQARSTVAALDREIRATREAMGADSAAVLDSLRSEVTEVRQQLQVRDERTALAEQERDDANNNARYWQRQAESLRGGMGIDPPPCWLDDDGNPEYIFRIELTDRGMTIFHIAPDHRTGSEVMRHAAAIADGQVYDPEAFLRLTLPIYRTGVARTNPHGPKGCRFWVRPVDRTGDRKDIFREREAQLGRRFWFRWPL